MEDVKQSIRGSVVDILAAISDQRCTDEAKMKIKALLEKAVDIAYQNIEEIKA